MEEVKVRTLGEGTARKHRTKLGRDGGQASNDNDISRGSVWVFSKVRRQGKKESERAEDFSDNPRRKLHCNTF